MGSQSPFPRFFLIFLFFFFSSFFLRKPRSEKNLVLPGSFLRRLLALFFSRRFSSEKSPTITVARFFSFFFRQTTDLIVYVPLLTDFTRSHVLVSTVFTGFTVHPAVTGSSPCFSQKLFRAFAKADETEGSLLPIFFRHCATFFEFFAFKRSHPHFFDILQQIKVPKSPKGLPFQIFWHYETVQNYHFSCFFFENLKKSIFLVSKGSSLQFFDILQTGFSKSPKAPFHSFKRFSSLRYTTDFRRSRLVGLTAWIVAEVRTISGFFWFWGI